MATVKRLIDANYFVNKGIRNCPIEDGGIPLGDFAKHQKILELYPSVDAVEVVRCKECQYREDSEVRDRIWCRKLGRYMKEDGFCSFGEGRNNE